MHACRRALVFLALVLPAAASADAVDPEPERCPPGSRPSTAHSGPYCAPTAECNIDADCGETATCDEIMQCIETRACGGLMPPDAAPCTLEHVAGACESDGTCAVGECRARRVCNGGVSGGGDDGGCGCRAAGAPSGAGLLPWLVLVAALTIARRRSLRRSSTGRAHSSSS